MPALNYADPNDYLELKDQSRLHGLPKDHRYFLRKMTLLFGASETGKSTIMDDLLYMLKPYMPTVFAIAPSNKSNGMFDGKLPSKAIKSGSDPTQTVKFLESVIARQKDLAEMYNNSNDPKILKPMFDMGSNEKERICETRVIRDAATRLSALADDSSLNLARKKTQRAQIEKTRKKTLVMLYKASIRVNKRRLMSMNINKFQRAALECLDVVPDLLLVFDDCASKFKVWMKESTVLKEIFYEGRQYYITTIITSQDDKEIDSSLRKNSMVSIFTTDQISISNFTRTSNGYPKFIASRAKVCIEKVFKQDEPEEHFRKLAYINNLAEPFRYFLADLHEDFQMGSKAFWTLNEKMVKGRKKPIETNRFFQRFA
jgi:hypothetical protein